MGYVGAGPRLPAGSAATLLLTNGPRKMPLGLAANVWNSCNRHKLCVSVTHKLARHRATQCTLRTAVKPTRQQQEVTSRYARGG